MAQKHCVACGVAFTPRPQIPNQRFCANPACQRERRRREQQARRNTESSRQANAQYLRDWAAKHPGYWRQYRASHPNYVARNRYLQAQRRQHHVAKEAVLLSKALQHGLFQLIPRAPQKLANEAVWIVEIQLLQGPSGEQRRKLQMKPHDPPAYSC